MTFEEFVADMNIGTYCGHCGAEMDVPDIETLIYCTTSPCPHCDQENDHLVSDVAAWLVFVSKRLIELEKRVPKRPLEGLGI